MRAAGTIVVEFNKILRRGRRADSGLYWQQTPLYVAVRISLELCIIADALLTRLSPAIEFARILLEMPSRQTRWLADALLRRWR